MAAANALSDIYAMGGVPRTAMNLVAFDAELYGEDTLAAILAGGLQKVRESGAVLIGGHTVKDKEPKFGLAVTGTARPDEIWRKAGAQPGDVLYLTKPIGTGVIVKAIKDGSCDPASAAAAIAAMTELNGAAADALRRVGGIHAVTDVTGFGLLGHARELAQQSGVTLEIFYGEVPVHPGALGLVEEDRVPSGSRDNLVFVQDDVTFDAALTPAQRLVLADAVTSGGLLVALEPSAGEEFERTARTAMPPRRIGTVAELGARHLRVR